MKKKEVFEALADIARQRRDALARLLADELARKRELLARRHFLAEHLAEQDRLSVAPGEATTPQRLANGAAYSAKIHRGIEMAKAQAEACDQSIASLQQSLLAIETRRKTFGLLVEREQRLELDKERRALRKLEDEMAGRFAARRKSPWDDSEADSE